jgi:hypothetical protein
VTIRVAVSRPVDVSLVGFFRFSVRFDEVPEKLG